MRKTTTNPLALAVPILCLFVLAACPPDAAPVEDTESVIITGIPLEVNGKDTYKVYVQLSEGTSAAAGHVAEGAALISEAQANGNTYTVTITELKDPDGNPWKGSNNKSANVVIRPKKVDSIADIEAKGNMMSSSKTLTLNWDNGLISIKDFISDADYYLLYQNIVVADGPELN
jgi:hypothetical protein